MTDAVLLWLIVVLPVLLAVQVAGRRIRMRRDRAAQAAAVTALAQAHQLPHVLPGGTVVWFTADGRRIFLLPDGAMHTPGRYDGSGTAALAGDSGAPHSPHVVPDDGGAEESPRRTPQEHHTADPH